MKPLDPRLLRYARSTRGFIVLTVVLGGLTAVLIITQARLLSSVIVNVTSEGMGWSKVAPAVLMLAGVFALRAILAWAAEVAAFRSSAKAKQELREATLAHVLELGPHGPAGSDPGEVATLITRGVDALDGYYARYLPQLMLAVIVPIAILLTMIGQDLLSTLIIAVTIPLIPLFMVLIGLYTRSSVDRQWATLAMLSGHFLDLIAGLPTLKIFGRSKAQAEAIRGIGDRYRSTTMGVLRVSFLSSLTLELLATLSVALVAVSVGLRLAEQQITYSVALFFLILAPEAYLPLRLVGQHFHAAAEGLGAADRMFTILETAAPSGGTRTDIPLDAALHVTQLQIRYPNRPVDGLAPTTFMAQPGTITALVGRSGGGKTSLLAALMGFTTPTSGCVNLQGGSGGQRVDLTELDQSIWRSMVGWVPQRAHLIGASSDPTVTIAGAVRLGKAQATENQIWAALTEAGVADEIRDLPEKLDAVIHVDSGGLSVGQLQRIALARALVRAPRFLFLDEPTAALDGVSEAAVVRAVQAAAARGCVVIVVAHRPSLMVIADQIVRIGADDTKIEPAPIGATMANTTVITGVGW